MNFYQTLESSLEISLKTLEYNLIAYLALPLAFEGEEGGGGNNLILILGHAENIFLPRERQGNKRPTNDHGELPEIS